VRVLVLGSGGREHALAWKLAQSPLCEALFCGPGNPGTASCAQNVPVRLTDPTDVVSVARALDVNLVVVGPEAPLVAGVADALRSVGIAVFGPGAAAAKLEGSKAFAKQVMAEAGVPTARAKTFVEAPDEALSYARTLSRVVVKADGLAAGKGVVVAQSPEESVAAIRELVGLGDAARTLVLEEFLEGEEISVIALCDGERYVLLPAAQDHKRVGENDTGPNTGGMGAYTPVPGVDEEALEEAGRMAIAPMLRRMAERNTPFVGALFAGLMLTRDGPRVLEYNCRLGDPETQVLMMQLEEDLLPLLDACARGALEERPLKLHRGASVGVVMAAKGYPTAPELGDAILGLEGVSDSHVFQAGTRQDAQGLVTAGGRVLTVCARGADLSEARQKAYAAVARIDFPGSQFRRDIGAKGLRKGAGA